MTQHVETVTAAEELNPFKIAQQQFDQTGFDVAGMFLEALEKQLR